MNNSTKHGIQTRDPNIVRKPIEIGEKLPDYWFGDELTLGFNHQPSFCMKARVTGMRYSYDQSEWLYCFELGTYPWSGQIWFGEWEVSDFQSIYQIEPVPSGYPELTPSSESNENLNEPPF